MPLVASIFKVRDVLAIRHPPSTRDEELIPDWDSAQNAPKGVDSTRVPKHLGSGDGRYHLHQLSEEFRQPTDRGGD